MISYEQVKSNEAIRVYIQRADDSLRALGYTEHSFAHVTRVAETVEYILRTLGYSEHEVTLGRIAAHLHDIGNLVNRADHSQSGAVMAFRILDHMGMDACDIATVVSAIGNHDEGTGVPVDAVAAALILGDKCDVRRSRVRNTDVSTFDIHDRVNYSVTDARVTVLREEGKLTLSLCIDPRYSSVMEYFEIFLERMMLCRRASTALGLAFEMEMNGQRVL